jgi:hypothetical protein
MSLLSDTNYSPQRIYSPLRLLQSQDGEMSFDGIRTWLNPTIRGIEQKDSEENINIRQLLGATTSLGLIEDLSRNQYRLTTPVPPTVEAFADAVHARLAALDMSHPDSIVLEAFAAMVVLTESEGGTSWLDFNAKDRADMINRAVRPRGTTEYENKDEGEGDEDDEGKVKGKNRFNNTKSPPWKRWMIFLGLGVPMPRSGDLYPYPAQRLSRELARLRAEGVIPKALEMQDFIGLVAERMPYLDNGRLFLASVDRVGLPALERRVSRVLSGTLRDLHDDKRLVLNAIGDAKETYELTSEPHAVKSIKSVTMEGPGNNG